LHTLSWIDRRGNEDPLPLRADCDATRVYPTAAVSSHCRRQSRRLVWNPQRKSLTRLTAGLTEDILPTWSPNGDRIYFSSNRTGTFDVPQALIWASGSGGVLWPGTQMVPRLRLTARGCSLENFKA
jgi:hypothetical protein